ncbi:MAG: hypothetical protein HQK51_00820 [Oligoflexia bacterium]|nr:hypothetical protein [Oligoflexia bacterium]
MESLINNKFFAFNFCNIFAFTFIISFQVMTVQFCFADETTQVLEQAPSLLPSQTAEVMPTPTTAASAPVNNSIKNVAKNSFIKNTFYQIMLNAGTGEQKLILDSYSNINDQYGYAGYDIVFQHPIDANWWPHLSFSGGMMFDSKKDASSTKWSMGVGMNRVFEEKWILGAEFGFKRVKFIVYRNQFNSSTGQDEREEKTIRENNFYLLFDIERFIFHKGPYFSMWGIGSAGILFPNNLDFNNKSGNYWMLGFKMRFSMQNRFDQEKNIPAVSLVYDEKSRDNYIVSIVADREIVYDDYFDDLRYSLSLRVGKEF